MKPGVIGAGVKYDFPEEKKSLPLAGIGLPIFLGFFSNSGSVSVSENLGEAKVGSFLGPLEERRPVC